MRKLIAKIDAATPATRDRAIDGLRALAILGVVIGHFFVMALNVAGDGALKVTSPLAAMPGLAPASWILQMLGLFFLVGGYATAKSYERAPAYGPWVRARLLRLARPVAAATAVLGALIPLLGAMGMPHGTLRTTAVLVVQPLWFVGIYAVITALTPAALWLDRKLRAWAAVPLIAIVALVDLLRYGVDGVPSWVGLINLLPGWAFAYVIGVNWAHGRIGRRGAALLAAGGLALGLLLVTRLGYPTSMVGVPGEGRTNAHPPSLLVLALAAAQSGVAILARDRLNKLLRKPALWAAVALANLSAMTIFCWHQIALMVLSTTTLATGHRAGLHDTPEGYSWLLHRLEWFPVYGLVLFGCVMLARRFEGPWSQVPKPLKTAAVALAALFGLYAATVM